MKIRYFTALAAFAGATFLFLTGCGSSTGSIPADIYVAGNDGSNAAYWKNGVETILPGRPATATSIAVSGSDVYVGGSSYSASEPIGDGSQATIWKNGVPTFLSTDFSSVSGITVANGNVYAVGFDENAAGDTSLATIWTNGTPSQLKDGMPNGPHYPNQTDGYSIAISGQDVYVSGTAGKCTRIPASAAFCAGVAVYWKNGVPTDLTQVTNEGPNGYGESIAVSGSNAYVAGSIGQAGSTPSQAVYWVNGTQVSLIPGNFTAQGSTATSIAVSGSDIYVSGGGNGYVQGYWINGKFRAFSTPSHFSQEQTYAIGVSGTDVYVAGSTQANFKAGFIATYWKNAIAVKLPTITGGSNATAIALVPLQ